MSSHIVPMNTQEVRETNKKRKKNKKKNRNKQKVIEQRNPYVDQGQSFIRSNLLKIQQEEIDTYEFKYFSNKPKTIFNTSFSTSFRNDILRFSGEDTLFTPTFLGKSMTADESDESSEEGTKILIEIDSSSEEESDFKHVDNNNSIKDVEKEEKSPSTESEEDLETMLKSVTYPSYDRASFKFTPIQSSSELYDSELTLKDYQLEAINFLFKNYCEKRPSCLAHEMGLGKTIISLSTLNTMYKKFGVYGPFLIVVPLITLPNWEREAKKWVPHFTSHTAWGTSANGIKGQVLRNAVKLYSTSVAEQKPLVVLTTYEFLKEDVISNLSWACVVFDEAHRLKSQKTQARKYVNQMKKEHFILLTGTPMQNSPQELWSLLNLMDPIAFKKYKLFEEKYGELESETAITNLKTAIAPYLIRRTKSQVLNAEMPPKEEILIEIELSSIQKSVYRAIVERKVNFFRKQFASKQDLTYIVNNLRYCCNHPCLISGMEEYLRDEQKRDDKGILIYSSSKMVVVHKLLKKFRDANEKALILSQFLDMLDILESYLQYEKIKYVRIDGSIPSEERQQHIDKFQTDPECRVFLLSTKISQGINLTAANHVIIYDSDFNPFNDSQAAARAHRIGQTKKVFVYRLVTKDSYEKYIISRASKKLGREKLVLAESDKSDEDLTAEEMERMIKFGVYSMFLNKDENANKDNELLNTDIDKILEGSSKIGVEGEDDGALVDVMNRVTGNDKPIEKVPEKQAPNEVIKSVYFVPVAEVSDVALDDPHFWDKTFPDYCDIYTLQARLDDIKPFEASEFESYFKKLEHVATEAINRKQVVSDDTEKLAKVVEEDKRGLPTKTQLHNFLLKFNSRKHNSFYHCLKQEHFDQIQKWLDQLETKTLRNKKVWASSADDIQEIKKEKSGSSSTAFNDMDTSDEDFDASSSDEVQTDDEFECDQEELEKETEDLHHLNIKIAPPAKKQKNSLNDRSILEKDSDDEKAEKSDTERPHKAPHKKPRRTNKKELKFTPYNVGVQNPPLPQIKAEVKPEKQTKAEKDPYSMKNQTTTVHQNNWHNTVPLQPSLHNTVRKPVPQPSSSSVATATTTTNQTANQITNQKVNQTANQAQLQLLEGLFKKAGVNNVVTKIQQPPSDPVQQEKRRTILLDPTKPQGNQSASNPKSSQPLVPLTNLSTTEILSRLSQAPNSIMEPLPKIPKQPAYQKLVAQQQQPTQLKPNPTVIPPKKASALILQQQNIQQQQMQTEKLLELLTKNTLKPPTQTPVVQPSTVNRSNANPSVANQQPIQPASRSTTRLASFTTLTTPQTTMNQQNQVHNPTPQPYLKDLVDPRRSAQGYTRPVVPVTNYQPQPPMNQNVSNQTAEPHVQQSAAFFRSLRHDPGSFQQMIQTMSLTNLKALGEQYFKNYSALKSNYWGNDKQQLIASSINLLTIINSQVQKIHAQQQQQQQQLQNNPFPQAFRTNPFAPPNATTPTTTNTTYQAYYTQSDGTRTMTSSSTTTIQQNATMPNMNQTIVPNNANTAALTPQPQQQGRVGIEYYRSIISQNNQNGQTSTTRVQSTTSVAPSLNNNTALQQLPPPTSTTSTTTPTSTEVPSLVDFSNDNTNYINNWFNFEH